MNISRKQGDHDARRIVGRHVLTEPFGHLVVVGEHGVASGAAGQEPQQLPADVGHGEAVGQQLLHDLAVGDEIDQRDVLAPDDVIEGEADEMGHGGLVAHHLRHAEEGGLQRRRAARHHRRHGMGQKGVGVVVHFFHRLAGNEPLVVGIVDRRCAGQHELIVECRREGVGDQRGGGLDHRGQVVLDLLTARAGQQGNDRTVGIELPAAAEVGARLMIAGTEGVHLLDGGIADIVDLVMMLVLVERHLEGQDGEQLADIAADAADAPLLPCPDLRRDVIVHGYPSMGMHILRDVEVEARVVDEDHHIGLPGRDVALAHGHVPENGAQMEQHGHEAHVGQLAVVLHARAADSRHQIASEEAELGIAVLFFQALHQPAGMQVATGLTHDEIILHRFQLFTSSI